MNVSEEFIIIGYIYYLDGYACSLRFDNLYFCIPILLLGS